MNLIQDVVESSSTCCSHFVLYGNVKNINDVSTKGFKREWCVELADMRIRYNPG
jgi:hypothetical protein